MINLLLDKLKLIAKRNGIKRYKIMSGDRLVSDLNEPESVKESSLALVLFLLAIY